MKYDPQETRDAAKGQHHRRTVRIKGYDYSAPGGYFITIVTQGRACLFGDIVNGEMRLSDAGQIAHNHWFTLSRNFTNVKLGTFVIMPNHIHGVIILLDPLRRGMVPAPQGDETSPLRRPTLGQVVAFYKYQSTKQINAISGSVGAKIWQRNYYEHILRNDDEHNRIHLYIESNPVNWGNDDENPVAQRAG